MKRGWMSSEVHVRKTEIVGEELLIEIWTGRMILVTVQKEKRRAREKALVLENACIIPHRMLVEIRMLKVLVLRSQIEMCNLLETAGRIVLGV